MAEFEASGMSSFSEWGRIRLLRINEGFGLDPTAIAKIKKMLLGD